MSFYNRNKKQSVKINRNLPLAKIIEEAGNKPEYRAVFYERILADNLYLLVESGTNTSNLTNGIDPNIPIITFANGVIPVFTAPDRIYDGGAITEEIDYIKVPGSAFFEMTIGNSIIVNPFSKVYKELIPMEISEMLNGTIFKPNHSPILHTKMNALIGEPQETPEELLQELINAYSQENEVASAYLGRTFNEKVDSAPHYIIAIEPIEGCTNFRPLASLTSDICKPFLHDNSEVIDIIKLEKGGNFSEFFYEQSSPFYVKK
ncbi:enhanced serine sensitivity protein SseB C-terminal domain-containing protein [Myroides injenensis]|uniref:enhanced serine sensitivity protein SseB C-terminal domain-containing protein n=1 Tax=Myroides injenensis TaxID=1183151 RepID=UPI0002895559|nr:enhanced serine sensitivity protein SseB C-terminal domain-containing protein [Myroides injenensis]